MLWNGDVSDGHDLALVRVPTDATSGIIPVRVGAPGDPGAYAPGVEVMMVGRGKTSPSSPLPNQLYDLHTVLHSNDYMDDIYNPWYWFGSWPDRYAIGAGWSDHTVCYGDSGGPLAMYRNGGWLQVGVASFVESWRNECAEPGGYAEVAGAQLAWLASKVPSIRNGWGSCRTSSGTLGQWYSVYQSAYDPTIHQDGPYYWLIWCGAQQSPTTTTTRPPTTTTTTAPDSGIAGFLSATEERQSEWWTTVHLSPVSSPGARTTLAPVSR